MKIFQHHTKHVLRVGLAAALLGTAALASAAPIYSVTALGTLGGSYSLGRGINDAGQVVGDSSISNGAVHAFLYDGSAIKDLGTLRTSSSRTAQSHADDINNTGQVVGDSTAGIFGPSGFHAFLYNGSTMTDLSVSAGTASFSSYATGINDAGQVVGDLTTANGYIHAFLYSPNTNTMVDLGTLAGNPVGYSNATDINNAGYVVGTSDTASSFSQHAFFYDGSTMIDLGTLAGPIDAYSIARGINNSGQIAGSSQIANGQSHAFLYEGSAMMDLGTLGGNSSNAWGINDDGQVVGQALTAGGVTHAFLYSGGMMKDLNNLIDPLSGWTITDARDINASGAIAAYGCKSGFGCQALRLDSIAAPSNNVPEPESLALVGVGLAGLALGSRKRKHALA